MYSSTSAIYLLVCQIYAGDVIPLTSFHLKQKWKKKRTRERERETERQVFGMSGHLSFLLHQVAMVENLLQLEHVQI